VPINNPVRDPNRGTRVEETGHTAMMKSQQRTTEQQPRRIPMPEWQTDKGRKHEAFESGHFGGDRRSLALAQRCDRKR